jgi:hypothetical protein
LLGNQNEGHPPHLRAHKTAMPAAIAIGGDQSFGFIKADRGNRETGAFGHLPDSDFRMFGAHKKPLDLKLTLEITKGLDQG